MAENPTKDGAGAGAVDIAFVIEKAKRELERMMDLNPQIMLLVNRDGVVIRTNRTLLDFLGLESFGDALNMPLSSLFDCVDPDFLPAQLAKVGATPAEALTRLPNGRERTLLYLVIASGVDGDLRMVIIDDITQHKAISVVNEKEHKIEAVEALMGGLMHHINQPLTVITVTARLMHLALEKGEWDAEEMKRNLQEIMDMTMKVAGLLNKARDPQDFVTEEYLDGMRIMDINRSSGGADEELPQA